MDSNPTHDHPRRHEAWGRNGGASASPALPAIGAECTIREMARDFGVSIRALRFYEDRDLLHPRREGTARLYGARERRDLKAILKGKQLGFTLTEIHDMLRSSGGSRALIDEAELELALPPEQIAAQIGYLERQRKDLDAAIITLRNAHRRLIEGSGRAALA